MKNLITKLLFACSLSVAFVACNKSDDTSYEDQIRQIEAQEKVIDSTLNAQRSIIESYVTENLVNPQQDSILYPYSVLSNETKRGIWYQIDSEPTDDSYSYQIASNGYNLYVVSPKVQLSYTAKLLTTGEVVEQSSGSSNFDFGVSSNVIKTIWYYAFYPYSSTFNGEKIVVGGLTKNGLKKGSKITVVTPSVYAYGSSSTEKIPANSPLVYEFEVLSINN